MAAAEQTIEDIKAGKIDIPNEYEDRRDRNRGLFQLNPHHQNGPVWMTKRAHFTSFP